MRYLYQQVLSFTAVVFVTALAVGMVTFRITKDQIYSREASQLEMVYQNIKGERISVELLEETRDWLEAPFNLKFYWYDANNQRQYPLIIDDEKDQSEDYRLDQPKIHKMLSEGSYGLVPFDMGFDAENPDAFALAIPLVDEKTQTYRGYLMIGQDAATIHNSVQNLKVSIMCGVGVASLLAILLAYMLASYHSWRINRLRRATHSVIQGEYSFIDYPHRWHDEFDALANDFNQMIGSLQASKLEIDHQEKIRHQLIMDIAHELRTPLTTMNGLLEGLRYHIFKKDKEERSLKLLYHEIQRLIRLVNENLDYEKIRAREISLRPVTFSLKAFFEDFMIQAQELAAKKEDTLLLEVAEGTQVYADLDRFRQIIFNIVNNAIQFTSGGTIQIEAKNIEEGACQIEITDTGIGMTDEEMENIWERCYKADESRKSNLYGESGLGLSIVKELMEAHNARINVTSQKGKGTTFRLMFPAQPENKERTEERKK